MHLNSNFLSYPTVCKPCEHVPCHICRYQERKTPSLPFCSRLRADHLQGTRANAQHSDNMVRCSNSSSRVRLCCSLMSQTSVRYIHGTNETNALQTNTPESTINNLVKSCKITVNNKMTAEKNPKRKCNHAELQFQCKKGKKVIDIYLTPGKQKKQTNQIPTFISLFLKTG